jgi:CheY-like chemotaxis protein
MASTSLQASTAAPFVPPLTLLVDPHEDTRALYKTYLVPHRYLIEEASDGREALAKAIADPPDIVVSETALPGIDGFDFCEILRRDRDTSQTAIIVLTGDAREASRRRAYASGADVVLVKPCLPADLLNHIERLRSRSVALADRASSACETASRRRAESAVVVAECRNVRRALSKSMRRYETTDPPDAPPLLFCPVCTVHALHYERSFVGGVSVRMPEQWDEFSCPGSCGTFKYRHRTKKLTTV